MERSESEILERRLSEIDLAIRDLKNERADIESALRVVARYVSGTKEGAPASPRIARSESGGAANGTPRPEGIPSLWEMTEEALSERRTATAAEIVRFIQGEYWPGVVHMQVGPSLYRFVKEGRLVKVGRGEFSLPPKENEPPSGGSETEEGDTSSKNIDRDEGDAINQLF